MSRAQELAEAHWEYISKVLGQHCVSDDEVKNIGFHYKEAFIHGYKHAEEDLYGKG